jgi:hypothetical protein
MHLGEHLAIIAAQIARVLILDGIQAGLAAWQAAKTNG